MTDNQPSTSSDALRIELERQRLELDKARVMLDHERLKLEHYKAGLDSTRATNEANRPFTEAVIRFADVTIRSLLLLNGGAALSLIAFAGNAISHNPSANVTGLARVLLVFGIGAALSVLTAGISYLAQVAFAEYQSRFWGNVLRAKAVGSAIVSWVLFLVGIIVAYSSFK